MTKLSLLRQVSQSLLNLLYPSSCASCGAADSHFCQACQAQLAYLTPPLCEKCGYPLDKSSALSHQCQLDAIGYLDSVRSVAFFHGTPLRPAIHKFKYENYRVLSQDFAPLLSECYQASFTGTDIIVPVPLHKSRYKDRGYNQSALLAKSLSRLIAQPVDTKTLIRQRATESQTTLSGAERQKNVAGAFTCTSNALAGQSILLVDDVFTTGATLNACAQALKQADAQMVHGLTLARSH